jgi:DNA-binding NarL/FixJ family response regulator
MTFEEERRLAAPSSSSWSHVPDVARGESTRFEPAPAALRVMLVDDHALVRSAVSQAIAAPDVELVAEASTAEDAFALALAVRPDIMLLDIDLPGMNGLQMLEELAPRLPDTKIVMLTVSDSERDMIEALARGAAGYLTKDLSPEALLRALRGTAKGELAMSRRFSARAMRHFVEAARKGRGGGGGVIEGLSPRENDVLRMLADGLTDREIAAALIISPRTVETHVSNVLHKLNVRKRAEAAQRYRESL